MTVGFKPYPEMQDSGVEWLGEVPKHWEVRRLRNTVEMRVSNVDKHTKAGEESVRLCNYVDVYKNDHIDQKIDFMRGTATHHEIALFRLKKDDVLITKDSETWDDIGVPALVTQPSDDLISGYHLALLRPFANCLIGSYLLRALQSKGLSYQFHVGAKGVTRYGLSQATIKSSWLPLPPLSEQTAIVRYLDYVDRRLRRLTRTKRKLVDLLTEQKQTIIHRAVTRGLDPDVPMKDSGIEWLGEVPAHWEMKRGKNIFTKMERPVRESDEVVTCFRDGRVTLRKNRRKEGFTESLKEIGYQGIRFGDLVIHAMDAFAGAIGVADSDGKSTPVYVVCKPKPQANVYYHAFVIREMARSQWILALATGIRERSTDFRFRTYANQLVHLPPFPEQVAIVEYLDKATAAIDAAIARANRESELLDEYRIRLIADVVTGKLDVREAAAALPEVDPLAVEDNFCDNAIEHPGTIDSLSDAVTV